MTAELIRKKPSKDFPVFYSLLSPMTKTLSSPLPPSIYISFIAFTSHSLASSHYQIFSSFFKGLLVYYSLFFILWLPLLPPTWFSSSFFVYFTLFSHFPLPDLLLLQSTLLFYCFLSSDFHFSSSEISSSPFSYWIFISHSCYLHTL